MNNFPYRILKNYDGDEITINIKRIEAILPQDAYNRHKLLMESGKEITLHRSITFEELNSLLREVFFSE